MFVTLAVLVAALAIGIGVLRSQGDLNDFLCDGDCGPRYVAAPVGLALADQPASPQVTTTVGGQVDPDAVARAVRPELDAAALGDRVTVLVADSVTGREVFSSGTAAQVPASTVKVLTGFAALSVLDPQHTFATRVVADGDRLVLVGGGDPYLATEPSRRPGYAVRADLATLARAVATELKAAGRTTVTLGYDAGLFTGRSASSAWPGTYVSQDIVTPVSALSVDGGAHDGRRDDDPAQVAAARFVAQLEKQGIDVRGEPAPTSAPRDAIEIASVSSATVAQIVERLEVTSDNEAAEVMLRHVAIASGEPATFEGGAVAVERALKAAGIDTAGLVLHDGSGLSRDNRVRSRTLVQTLREALAQPRTASLAAGLPVGGFNGSLGTRFGGAADGRGVVRAKTGTLTGVHGLAGFVTTRDDRTLVFAVLADRTRGQNPFATQAALDAVAAALADCTCGLG